MNRFFGLLFFTASSCVACGPWFPEAYVLRNDDVFYAPPVVGFSAEIRYLIPDSVPHEAVLEPESNPAEELSLVLAALENSEVERQAIVESYNGFRNALNEAKLYMDRQPFEYYVPAVDEDAKATALEVLEGLVVPTGLPLEFEYYLKGALAYYQSDLEGARVAWQAVLDLPEDARHYRSVMAAYMLGKIADRGASKYYKQVRALVADGYADPQGLAAASYGREAQYFLSRADRVADSSKPYKVAIDLYLKQSAAGYRNASQSLSTVARDAWQQCDEQELASLLKDPAARAVLTAYVLTECWGEQADGYRARLRSTLPSPKELSVEDAGRFALMEYQQNNMAATRLWLEYAEPKDALALWVRSKMHLREGRLDEGRALMVALTEELGRNDSDWRRVDTSRAWAELGLLLLQQERFVEAADCFYHSGSWEDCAYVLERLLHTDELIDWVRSKPRAFGEPDNYYSSDVFALAARRLMRAGRFEVALEFFDEEARVVAESYINAMQVANDSDVDPVSRARAYWDAARLLRDYGMPLMGSELAPDFAWIGGSFEWADTYEDREANHSAPNYHINQMTWAESKRAEATKVRPNKRFHYRYRATLLAELAAGLLPNNDADAARIYCVAGEWLRVRDPDAADRLYKLLVVRCPETALGREAAKLNWFPAVDLETIAPFAEE